MFKIILVNIAQIIYNFLFFDFKTIELNSSFNTLI